MMKSLFIVLCAAILISTVYALDCRPGQYVIRIEIPGEGSYDDCQACGPGRYCPGDNQSHECPDKTFNEEFGKTSCVPCNRPSDDHKACYLDDTPEDVRRIEDLSLSYGSSTKYSVKGSAHFVFPQAYKRAYERDYLPTVNVFQKPGQTGIITAYLSNITGHPTEANHQFKATGVNITALLTKLPTKSNNIYLTLDFQRPSDINVGIYTGNVFYHTVAVGETRYKQTAYLSLTVFTVPNVPKKSRVTLSISTAKTTRTDYLYWSSDKSIPYPNELNYQARHVNNRVLTVEDEGNVTFSFYTYISGPSDVDSSVKVEIEQL
ncbi:hypothetical protein AKO1_013204 [Acrasis kona]|uniref:Uncharacterized protein n=1 Tax=Acrasis kona TaxID=1008807 RepID=A0AAW2YKK6_9EUKA